MSITLIEINLKSGRKARETKQFNMFINLKDLFVSSDDSVSSMIRILSIRLMHFQYKSHGGSMK